MATQMGSPPHLCPRDPALAPGWEVLDVLLHSLLTVPVVITGILSFVLENTVSGEPPMPPILLGCGWCVPRLSLSWLQVHPRSGACSLPGCRGANLPGSTGSRLLSSARLAPPASACFPSASSAPGRRRRRVAVPWRKALYLQGKPRASW